MYDERVLHISTQHYNEAYLKNINKENRFWTFERAFVWTWSVFPLIFFPFHIFPQLLMWIYDDDGLLMCWRLKRSRWMTDEMPEQHAQIAHSKKSHHGTPDPISVRGWGILYPLVWVWFSLHLYVRQGSGAALKRMLEKRRGFFHQSPVL